MILSGTTGADMCLQETCICFYAGTPYGSSEFLVCETTFKRRKGGFDHIGGIGTSLLCYVMLHTFSRHY